LSDSSPQYEVCFTVKIPPPKLMVAFRIALFAELNTPTVNG
jgi:hypothetical protein